jgi:hypothetical protein
MTRLQIMAMQKRIGVAPDGFWGPKSIAACQQHLRRMMPKAFPWPMQDQASLTRFYGAPGDESQLVNLPAPVAMRYDGKRIRSIRCHKRVASSLSRALAAAHAVAPEVVADYAGCYANRPMRGGTLPSLHARGAAIDLSPSTNGNRTAWPVNSTMPLAVMEAFAREGWLSAGAFWGRDGMHFQATW